MRLVLFVLAGFALALTSAPFWLAMTDNFAAYAASLYAQEQQEIQCANDPGFCWNLGFHFHNSLYHFELILQSLAIALSLSAAGIVLLAKGGAFGQLKRMAKETLTKG